MLIKYKKSWAVPTSEVTPESVYLSRRQFMQGAAALSLSALLAACGGSRAAQTAPVGRAPATGADLTPGTVSEMADELGDTLTPYNDIITYNNYYEFSTDKQAVSRLAAGYMTSPWQVEVGGLVNKPGTYDVDDLKQLFDQEERIYRLRCVEAWSMVIPWIGFPMSKLLAAVEPKAEAKYVRFETIYDPDNMPGQKSRWYEWPYVEGLRLDEAMNDLAIFATGLYGKDLLPQSGSPIRVVVPWKYGFKSIKSIVKIELVAEQPTSLWMAAAPNEYGFYANVNPEVNHPRWSQSSERRIGELSRRPTLEFNGYAEQVAHLYADMDLRRNY